MREVIQRIYQLTELSDEAKQKVIEAHRYIQVEGWQWWDAVYWRADDEGVEIFSFDLQYQDIELNVHNEELVIQTHHDEFGLELLADLVDEEEEEEYDARQEALIEKVHNFCCDKYLKELHDEYEWLTSDESIVNFFEANEWEFFESGQYYYG